MNFRLAVVRNSVALCAMLFALCTIAEAQQQEKVPRIGYLSSTSLSAEASRLEGLRQALRDLGYTEGKNIVIEYRSAEGKLEQLPELAAELVRIKVDIIVASTENAVRAAKNATKGIPVVMVDVGTDPVSAGLVESLARPGGNITGLALLGQETSGKRLELFKEAVPKIGRVAILYDPANRGNLLVVKEVQSAGRALGLTVQPWEVTGANRFETVFAALSKERPDGVFLTGGPLMVSNYRRIVDFSLKSRLPSAYNRREPVEAGGLMSYGADRAEMYRRRAAVYVDKILKGAKPADLPVEQPTKFELVINLKTAKRLGLTIPQSVLYRADKVIK